MFTFVVKTFNHRTNWSYSDAFHQVGPNNRIDWSRNLAVKKFLDIYYRHDNVAPDCSCSLFCNGEKIATVTHFRYGANWEKRYTKTVFCFEP